MTEPILLREADVADARAIAEISVDGWQQGYAGILPAEYLASLSIDERASGWVDQLSAGAVPVIVAVVAGDVVGFAAAGASRDAETPAASTGEIYAIYVSPACWGRGIGRSLLTAAIDLLTPDYTYCTMWVLSANERARGFYASNGFSPDGMHRVESRRGAVLDEVRYARRLA